MSSYHNQNLQTKILLRHFTSFFLRSHRVSSTCATRHFRPVTFPSAQGPLWLAEAGVHRAPPRFASETMEPVSLSACTSLPAVPPNALWTEACWTPAVVLSSGRLPRVPCGGRTGPGRPSLPGPSSLQASSAYGETRPRPRPARSEQAPCVRLS